MESPNQFPENFPSNEKITKQAIMHGGELLIVGLNHLEATALVEWAKENGHKQVNYTNGFAPDERTRLIQKTGKDIPLGTESVVIAHDEEQRQSIFRHLGIL